MLERKAMADLVAWKERSGRQGLLVTGARQVGKTTLIREFAVQHYDVVVELNFFEQPEAVETIRGASSTKDLLLRISALADTELVPGKTLVFFDEVQEFADILTWVKFLEERSDLGFIFSGSLLGVDAFDIRSWPVGFLRTLQMYPLDFEEFCTANGVTNSVMEEVRNSFVHTTPVPDFIHDKLVDLYQTYLLIGGMPDAVQAFINTSDLQSVRMVQRSIVDLYQHDFSKYMSSKEDARFAKALYNAIPSQLDKENKRFKFKNSVAPADARFAYLETSFDWLEQAGVALPVFRVTEPMYPLELHETRSSFKLFMNDIGLLTSRLMGDVALDILRSKTDINYGSLYENAVAQELRAQGFSLYYYHSTKRGEVDFVIQNGITGEVSLLEIKSGKDYKRHVALTNLLDSDEYTFDNAFVFCNGNVERKGKITYLPIYQVGLCSSLR